MVSIRPATADDCGAVSDIYRHYVENSMATFDCDAPDVAEWQAKRASIVASGRPFLVVENPADDSGDDSLPRGVLGYAYLASYRGKTGWSWTAEDSIYLVPDAGGRGIGTRLLRALLDATDPEVTRHVMAVITEEVPESVKLHERAGFTVIGRSPGVGYKFGRWVGVVYMQYSFPITDGAAAV